MEVITDKYFRTIVGGRSTAYKGWKSFPRGIEILINPENHDPKHLRSETTDQGFFDPTSAGNAAFGCNIAGLFL